MHVWFSTEYACIILPPFPSHLKRLLHLHPDVCACNWNPFYELQLHLQLSSVQEINVGNRKYNADEWGVAEMCDMFCRTLGRGHIHIQACDAMEESGCTHAAKDGRRHETRRYVGMESEGPKDELTHDAHWASMGWRDPCSTSKRRECTSRVFFFIHRQILLLRSDRGQMCCLHRQPLLIDFFLTQIFEEEVCVMRNL